MIAGGPAPTRAHIEELLPDVLNGRIETGRVFDRVARLDNVPDGYRAINNREAIIVIFETPLVETLKALDDLLHSGKVRYIGCSNYPAWLLTKGLWIGDKLGLARFDSVQPRYNLLFRHIEAELLPLTQGQGIGVISYNPLAGGVLTVHYQAGQPVEEGSRFAL